MGSLRKAAGLMVPIFGGGFFAACALGLLFAACVSIFEGKLDDGALLAGLSCIALLCSLFILSELGWRRKFLQATKAVFHIITLPITLPVTAVINPYLIEPCERLLGRLVAGPQSPLGPLTPPKSFMARGIFQFIAFALTAGGLLLLASGAKLCYSQLYTWLKHGYWQPYPIAYFIEPPELSWRGVEKIVVLAMKFPSAIALIVLGSTILYLAGTIWHFSRDAE